MLQIHLHVKIEQTHAYVCAHLKQYGSGKMTVLTVYIYIGIKDKCCLLMVDTKKILRK